MAENQAQETQAEEEGAKKGGKSKLILFALVGLLLIGGGGGAAGFFLGWFGGKGKAEAEEVAEEADKEPGKDKDKAAKEEGGKGEAAGEEVVFVELPDLLVNLRSSGRRMRYLKLRVALEVADEEQAERIKTLLPRVIDSFQLYLRALSVDELRGAVGMEQLKEELLARVNRVVRPARAEDVLFKEILVQ